MEQPKSLFKKGDVVRYNNQKLKEITDKFTELRNKWGSSVGNAPTHALRIYDAPRWDGTQYIYNYEYGFSGSEGSAK